MEDRRIAGRGCRRASSGPVLANAAGVDRAIAPVETWERRPRCGLGAPSRVPPARAGEDAPPCRRPRAARAPPRRRPRTQPLRPRPARPRRARPARLPRLRHPGPRLCPGPPSRLRFRAAGGLQLQGPLLPLLQRPPHGGRRRPPRPRRLPARPRPPVGPVLPEAAPLPRGARSAPGLPATRRLHPDPLRLAAALRQAARGGRSADRRRHRGPALRRCHQSERPLPYPGAGRRLRPLWPRGRPGSSRSRRRPTRRSRRS